MGTTQTARWETRCSLYMGYSFRLASKAYRIVHNTAFVTPVVQHWLERVYLSDETSRSSMVKRPHMLRWDVGSIPSGGSFQSVLDKCRKAPVMGRVGRYSMYTVRYRCQYRFTELNSIEIPIISILKNK